MVLVRREVVRRFGSRIGCGLDGDIWVWGGFLPKLGFPPSREGWVIYFIFILILLYAGSLPVNVSTFRTINIRLIVVCWTAEMI